MVLNAIKNRRSVRFYRMNNVLEKHLEEVLKAAQFAPTAMNSRAVEFVVVTNRDQKAELFKILGQDFIRDAPVIIVPVCDTKKSVVPQTDIAIASSFIMLQASELELGTVWKHVMPEQVGRIKAVLDIPEYFTLINVLPLGYPKEMATPHTDKEYFEKKVHLDRW